MEANRQRKYSGTTYLEGNTARKLSAVPERPSREREYEERRITREREISVPRRKAGIDFMSFLVLTVAIALTMYVCVEYIQVQSGITQMQKKIVSLEKQVSTLKSKNDAQYAELQQAVDLGQIYEIAVGELGMVYPKDNEIVTYTSEQQDYVIQYQDVPKVEKNLLENIMK